MSNQAGSNPTQQHPSHPPLVKVRRQKADPLVRPKKRLPPRPAQPPAGVHSGAPAPQRPTNLVPPPSKAVPPARETAVNGFTGPPLSDLVTDYPVVTTKRALLEGLRHHVARFTSKKNIDPRDESQFTRPVRLQRRDPRATQAESVPERPKPVKGQLANLTEAEREELESRRIAKEKEREESLAQIAPSAAATQKRTNVQKQRTQQVFKAEMTPDEIARARVKYEEALPWHLEDFDNRSTWVGNYEAAMSETYVMFVPRHDRKMSMIPLDKWYKFTAKKHFRPMSVEEAEKHMAKQSKEPTWLTQKMEKESEHIERRSGLYTGKHDAGGSAFEADEMDFEEDRFADDEERADLFGEEDEDTKIAEERIKKDQIKANIFNLKDERVYDEEELQEKREKEAFKHHGKRFQKVLKRREKNFDYSSGSDDNPYGDSSSESEEELEEQRRLQDQQKSEAEAEVSTGAASRPKAAGAVRKEAGSSTSARKRVGSPGLSDASGTDTSRKRTKKKTGALQSLARPMSPSASQASAAVSKKRARSAQASPSGSDVERGVASGGDASDMGSKKLKLNPLGQRSPVSGTPLASRAGSPAPAVSRTGSVGAQGPSPGTSAPVSPVLPFPTPAEVHAAIPATGISSAELLRLFRTRLGDSKQNQARFITVVKEVSVYGKDKLLRPGSVKPE